MPKRIRHTSKWNTEKHTHKENQGHQPLDSFCLFLTSLNSKIANHSYTALTAGSNVTIQEGGRFELGDIVFINVRFKPDANLSANDPIITGLQNARQSSSNFITFASSNKDYSFYLDNDTHQIKSGQAIASGTAIMLSGFYLKY